MQQETIGEFFATFLFFGTMFAMFFGGFLNAIN